MKADRQTLDLFGTESAGEAGVASEPEALRVSPELLDSPGAPHDAPDDAPDDAADLEADEEVEPDRVEESGPSGVRSEPRVWSVSEVNRSVREMLEDFLPPLWVSGEIANWTAHRSGHRYFTLKDDQAQIRCVMWRGDARRLPIDPENGMNVRAFGGLTLYEARGEYQLAVREIETRDADGLWRLAFEKLRRKLDAEGLLDPRRKRPLPRHPRAVGIVTSATGAALQDILTGLRRRAPWTQVLVRSCRVQGDGAAAEIADAIRVLAASGRVDLLVVGRGGGSIEDLWAFNEEPVARAIAACPLPVVSAVGHEVDVTIADLVADLRAPTPTAAAELVVPDRGQIADALAALPVRLGRALRGAVDRRGRRITDAAVRLERGMRGRVAPTRERIDRAGERSRSAVERRIERRRQALGALGGRLDALSPLATLGRGYAVAQDDGGRLLRRTSDFTLGVAFRLRVSDGDVRCAPVDRAPSHERAPDGQAPGRPE